MEKEFKRLPQELFAEALLFESKYGVISSAKIEDLLRKNNLKLKKGKSIDDIRLAIGKGLKNAMHNTPKAIEQIAEEIDKICTIARWDFAVEKYKSR